MERHNICKIRDESQLMLETCDGREAVSIDSTGWNTFLVWTCKLEKGLGSVGNQSSVAARCFFSVHLVDQPYVLFAEHRDHRIIE